jgi:hypothetical protein
VDGLKAEQIFIAKFFGTGLLFFHISALMYAWVAFPNYEVVTLLTVMLSVFIIMFMGATNRIMAAFEIPDDDVVTGVFGDDDLNMEETELSARRRKPQQRGGV